MYSRPFRMHEEGTRCIKIEVDIQDLYAWEIPADPSIIAFRKYWGKKIGNLI